LSIRVLLADDHQIMRQGLRALLEAEPDFEVVGEADNGRMALQMAKELKPQVGVMDIGMPDLNGVEATRKLTAELPRVRVLALSMHSDTQFIQGMLQAGAYGYLLKDSAVEELVGAIRAVAAEKTYLSPTIAGSVVDHFVRAVPKEEGSSPSPLTAREREILQLLAEGNTTKQMAYSLHISVKTVETHRRQIMLKLDIHTVAELTKYAVREGMTSLD